MRTVFRLYKEYRRRGMDAAPAFCRAVHTYRHGY
jgi:hypothetical protein